MKFGGIFKSGRNYEFQSCFDITLNCEIQHQLAKHTKYTCFVKNNPPFARKHRSKDDLQTTDGLLGRYN